MRKLLVLFVPVLFFVACLITLKDYGVSWDEPEHFLRGQGYLHFFLTGEKKFAEDNPRKSYYQDNSLPAKHFFENDNGHPPLNDILAASSNYIFYQKLGIMGDIESHHLFNILSSTLLVLVVSVFAYKVGGLKASLISGTITGTYPLFFSEAHFNIKDPPQAAFYSLAIFAFWLSLKKNNWKWLLLSAISVGFSFGMKFNILFLPFIILPYLFLRYWPKFSVKNIPKKYFLVLLTCPLIVFGIFFVSWPFLWADPFENFLKIMKYYKEIGTGSDYQPGYYFLRFNLYPLLWIVTTTPPVVLLSLIVGLFIAIKDRSKEKTLWLWVLWLVVPIARVSIPGASIYGGVRQIMEYIPAMALIAGFAVSYFINLLQIKFSKLLSFLVTTIFIGTSLFTVIKFHPNQNVYFNFLINGLKGASEKNIPYWGNSYGNAYLMVTKWLNQNAEKDAHLALIQGTALNIPAITLRSDIVRWNSFWSGIDRRGEYLTELTYGGIRVAYPYAWEYVDMFLEPVYEVKVDGVAIAKLWKNDLEHTKESMKNKKEISYLNPRTSIKDGQIITELRQEKVLNKIVVSYLDNPLCVIKGSIYTSKDLKLWTQEPEVVPADQISERKMVDKGKLTFYFPGRVAKGVKIVPDTSQSCLLKTPKVEIFILE